MAYPIEHIAQIITAKKTTPFVDVPPIEHLIYDSRILTFPKTSIFFALSGQRNDGHHYLEALYQKGVQNFVVSREIDPQQFPNANILCVDDPLIALQQLTAFHRQQFDIPVIGITGSNGKTIVKEWLFQLLHQSYYICRSPKSYNSQIGVPLSVWPLQSKHQLGIFEAGISQRGEMEKIAPLIDCSIGLFTNIGTAHNEGFTSLEEKIREKAKLFADTATLIYSADHQGVQEILQAMEGKRHLSWSATGQAADLQIIAIEKEQGQSKITGKYQDQSTWIRIPFQDEAAIENAIHCWAVLLYLNIPSASIIRGMRELEPVGMRLEMKNGINNCVIINDSYNSDFTSLGIALNFLAQQSPQQKRHLILSDILQSGRKSDALYADVADLLLKKNIDTFTGIGKEVRALDALLPKTIKRLFFEDTDSFLRQFNPEYFQNTSILLKGARAFAFERIANRLSLQVHQTVLEVNLTALVNNLNVYNTYLQPDTKMMVMVKASAYGSGSYEVARMLSYQQVDYLAVAYCDEGIELRKAGIQLPILVLNPEENTMGAMLRYDLEPEIYSLALLQQLIRHGSRREGQRVAIHLKLETGMRRLGFEEKDLPELLSLLAANPFLEVKSIFSHLAASEAAQHDGFTELQFTHFQRLYEVLCQDLGYRPLRHILNSSGISRFPQYQLEMVRLGIGLYGIDNAGLIQDKLEVVLTLKARISQIKEVPAGESIGYGRKGQADQTIRIATISIGYADGLLRAAGNRHFSVFVRECRAPIVGNVCMDMCMIDISQIPDATIGDEVTIFGKEPKVEELAKCLHTIPYEVFTNLSGRVKRVYFQEA